MTGDAPDSAAPPATLTALRALILQSRDSLPKRLLQAADYALSHPQEFAFATIGAIAQQAGVQPSALVRFAQSLGYSGFSELQAVFRAHARDRWPDYRERLETLRSEEGGDGPAALLRGFIGASLHSVERLSETLDAAALDRAIGLLAAAPTIHLLGSRRAFPVAAYLAYALRKLEIRCHLIDQAGGLAPEQVALMAPGDVLLAVSFSPYAPATLELVAAAAARGHGVVALTDTPFSPLAASASAWLEVAEADHAGFRSLAGTFALAMTLAVGTAEARLRAAG
ncbi:RpiR family transcriptional regulator [Pseudoroseomonas deserti]|uniref:RpiR family transcriptional regulator n=1 Tax=Teichococcus deserti TaxID=1817963 RepID=A0A1V2H2S8_9PROT|nr:MurR/RpiR family transcriptional regulator [Pseudoroseomonas deserti]ONG51784.1 RpiR family transcriptional regulator [Pseudoroseomonas deserti]